METKARIQVRCGNCEFGSSKENPVYYQAPQAANPNNSIEALSEMIKSKPCPYCQSRSLSEKKDR